MRYRVHHLTEYRYSAPLTTSHTVAHLRPRETAFQRVLHSEVSVEPAPQATAEHRDAFGNTATTWSITEPHDHLVVEARCEVQLFEQVAPAASVSWDWLVSQLPGRCDVDSVDARWMAMPTELTRADDEITELARRCCPPGRPVHEAVAELSAVLHQELSFDPGATDVSTPATAVWAQRRGVCQDFAHLTLAALRSVGLPARYVSGYLETDPPPGQPRLIGADASHAWCSVWLGDRWLDLDPTNDQVPPTRHVTVAYGRDFTDVVPVRGVVFGPPAHQSLHVSVDVTHHDH